MAETTFRIADINDVIFNTVGIAIGYVLFLGFVRVYRRISPNWEYQLRNPRFPDTVSNRASQRG
jgi:glycopeptide antibiotics resistance protein